MKYTICVACSFDRGCLRHWRPDAWTDKPLERRMDGASDKTTNPDINATCGSDGLRHWALNDQSRFYLCKGKPDPQVYGFVETLPTISARDTDSFPWTFPEIPFWLYHYWTFANPIYIYNFIHHQTMIANSEKTNKQIGIMNSRLR